MLVARFFTINLVGQGETYLENLVTCMKNCPVTRDEHKWKDGKCDFLSLTMCSCGQCDEGDVKCEGKAYKTRNMLTYPYYSLAYQIECEKVRNKHLMSFTLCSVEATLIEMRPLTMF